MANNSIPAWPEASNSRVTNTLDSFLAGGKDLPQAYLFLGQSSINELAETFASKITENKYPNIDTLSFDAESEGSIDAMREVLRMVSLMPVSSDRKVVMMEHMERASTQVLNALLKTLEEPPSHAVFILLSSRPLIATVMSRCQVFSIPKTANAKVLESEDLSEALELLEKTKKSGMAERTALVSTLSNLDDNLLLDLVEIWMYKQVDELKTYPEKYTAVRSSMETLQSLHGNFNKKMVLQNFVSNGIA
jgi:DNA polymerase III delta prime subunit